MRRNEKEVTEWAELEKILWQGRVCQLAIPDVPAPYVVPLNYGYRDGLLYFHSAAAGHKIELLQTHPQVGFSIVIDLGLVEGKQACNWSMRYRSVTGRGQVRFIESLEGKRRALDRIMAQYAKGDFDYPEDALKATCLFQLQIEEMTGKQSRLQG